jgi:alpha-D-xyloside xylohydrolase
MVSLDLRGFVRVESLRASSATAAAIRAASDAGQLEFSVYGPGIFRLRGGPAPANDYGLLIGGPQPPAPYDGASARGPFGGRLEDGAHTLEVASSPFGLRLRRRDQTLLESTTDGHIRGGLRMPRLGFRGEDHPGGAAWIVAFALGRDEAVYGLGEKFGSLNHRGQLITSWNEDAWGVNAEAAYKNAPFAWSPDGWGLFVHTTARVYHGVGYPQWSHRGYVLQIDDASLDLFLMAAATPAELLERYTYLTGRAPAPPRWSFGVWMSRCYYRTAAEAMEAARTLREHRIPCDVLVLDGRAWLKVDTRFAFEWDADRYPDPAAFVREVKALNLRLCLWEYPYVSIHNPLFDDLASRGFLLKDRTGKPYVYRWSAEPFATLLTPLPPSGMVDFTHPGAYAWFQEAHQALFEAGADVMKTDFDEQIPHDAVAHNGDDGRRLHNVYPLLFNRCVYEATERYSKGREGALVWGRSGWTGSQRYPVQWGGDPQSDWDGLAASIRGALSWGLSGAPFDTHDIGGFYGDPPDAELYVRWTQAGVMASHTRFHGTSPREPWHFGEDAERIVRRWLEWRYRLIPYLESCALDAHQTGMPVMRAMPLAFPADRDAHRHEHQYLFGPALLVAPVLAPGGTVRVYLPAGRWYDLHSGARLEGPRAVEMTVPLDLMPMFGRDGHVLPLGPAAQHTGELDPQRPIDEIYVFGQPERGLTLPTDIRVRIFS